MIYEIRQEFLRSRVVEFHYYGETNTTFNFPLLSRNTVFKKEENKIDFIYYVSNLIFLYMELAVFFIG